MTRPRNGATIAVRDRLASAFLSLANFPLRLRQTPLRRENGKLALGLNERRLRGVEGGPFLNEVGVGLLRLLQRPGPLFEQILRPPVLVLGIAQRRLRRVTWSEACSTADCWAAVWASAWPMPAPAC